MILRLRWPEVERALLFGPLSPVSLRLQGPDRLNEAATRTLAGAQAFGAIRGPEFTPEELRLRSFTGSREAVVA
ncbi:hypothetical protein [Cupriavidus sp. IDO]|uniref:hypothetical protein n=1 Tax=Cupriavidus sp. IDO TaxID=1539142 RepID=UPI00057962DC|nr:hypothetical protein [Cupriavidus sp. IDO]KWR87691.1 hypothetical protein RM96_23730 [Cupriavidus sp. IDO]